MARLIQLEMDNGTPVYINSESVAAMFAKDEEMTVILPVGSEKMITVKGNIHGIAMRISDRGESRKLPGQKK